MPRKTAVWTKGQREYLRGDREPTQEGTMRTRMRQRLRAGLQDISLLINSDRFDSNDIRDSVGDGSLTEEEREELTPAELDAHATNLVALAVLVDEFTPEHPPGAAGTGSPEGVEEILTVGVEKAFRELGITLLENEHSVERSSPLGKLLEEPLETLSGDQLIQLHQAGRITDEEYSDAVVSKQRQRAAGKLDRSVEAYAEAMEKTFSEVDAPTLVDIAARGSFPADTL